MNAFKIATWNVNSLRVRLPYVLNWLETMKPDVLALQEIKSTNDDFHLDAIKQAGYTAIVSGQKTYNGVAILTKHEIQDVITDVSGLDDPQRRILGVTIKDMRIFNLYVPNGQSVGSDKYQYKLNWLEKLTAHVKAEMDKHHKVCLLGDFNIAPEDLDVHDPNEWMGQVLCSEPERQAFRDLLQMGLKDCYRVLHPTAMHYSWWDYRMNAYKRNLGLRIDHILTNEALAAQCISCQIDHAERSRERPSDHAPVLAAFHI